MSAKAHGLGVAVTTANAETFAGTLVELDTDDAEANFPRGDGPTLPVGLLVTLIFTAPWLLTPIQVVANVVSRVEAGQFRTYGYRLKFDSEELRKRLSREAGRVHNQRTANRVEPAPTESVAVELKLPASDQAPSLELPVDVNGDFTATGHLKDISTGGIGVLVDGSVEDVLAATERVDIAFQLPISNERLQLTGWIRHRRLKDARMSYGIQFDTELSENFTTQLDQIIQYIVHRQEQE